MGMLMSLVPGLLGKLSGGFSFLSKKSEDNPKSGAGLAVIGGLLTLFGVSPESLHSVGGAMVMFGQLLKGF